MTPSSGSINLLEKLAQRNIYLHLPAYYKKILEGMQMKSQNEEVHRGGPEGC